MSVDITDMPALAAHAAAMLVLQRPVSIAHPAGWERPSGWPLPAKRAHNGAANEYRPLAILEFVHDELSGANRSRSQSERITKTLNNKAPG